MSKIVLSNIYLVNWYGFVNTKIPVDPNLTLITGENECGKSTILDAVKYAFTGDSEFNKSSSVHNIGGSRRTLNSYTRCLLDPSAGTYARPPEQYPNIYSHISLEYYDEVNENHFILGVILETNSSNTVSPYWYALDHTRMNQIHYTYEDKGRIKAYSARRFQEHYGIQIMTRKDAMRKFMQMTGLKLAFNEIGKFQRKLRNIMTYNPAAKIQEFIKESVLEAHDVNFDKLRDAKNNIERINQTLELIQEEVQALEEILKHFAEHEKVSFRLSVDDAKINYRDLLKIERSMAESKAAIEKNIVELKQLEKAIQQLESVKEKTESEYLKAKSNLNELDCRKAIEAEEHKLAKYKQQQVTAARERKELSLFQDNINSMLELLSELDVLAGDEKVLQNIETDAYTPVEKENTVNHFKETVSEQKDRIIEQRVAVSNQIRDVQAEINYFDQIIEVCNKNKPDYSSVKEQMALLDEINREFKRNGINQPARFACEYVAALRDEEWRAAIEAFLGIHRYSIIVEPEYFDLANTVLDKSANKYVELVNTGLLLRRKVKCVDDAVLKKLVIKNETAYQYFAYWLGRIHAVDMKDVSQYENAMSKEGKLSRNMAVTFINMKKLKTFCLGQEAVELNRIRAVKQKAILEQSEKKLLADQEKLSRRIRQLGEYLGWFKEYNYNANSDYDLCVKNINETTEKLNELNEAQNNNMEFLMLNKRVQELTDELSKIGRDLDGSRSKKNRLELENNTSRENLHKNTDKRKILEEKLDYQRMTHPSEVKTAIREYDDFLNGKTKEGDIINYQTRERQDRRKRELEGLIIGGQKDYNRRKQEEERLPEGLKEEGRYMARKNKIWVDDLQEINAKMAEQTRKYEAIFKNEFVLSLYQTALSAKDDIAGINRELRKLQFATKYQFDVNLLDDKSDFAKILRYAEYLKKINKVDDGQLAFGELYGYEDDEIENREQEIKGIINRIIDKNDLSVIKEFADYRNYMSYEIIINNADVKDGRLSKQAGYNSGAGTQIPYTLILSAALSMLYNARANSVRLIFIDEPFEKMSDYNIKLMLDFFKGQNFQVIFCAPPNKTDSIGIECDTIIPVIKIKNDNMQIGSVQFNEKK